MPNLVKFREDPDAMLVMSLEDYDEVTDKATKAAIMLRDVVGRTPPVTHVRSAEAGLLVSLNQRGTVDLPFIATLYVKPEQEVIAELGDLIFHDPESKSWQTADAYLSGNVRAKLACRRSRGSELFPQRSMLCGRFNPKTFSPATSTPISALPGYRQTTFKLSRPSYFTSSRLLSELPI